MKWIVAFLFSFLWGICILSAQNPNYIKVIVPENDSTSIAASNQRINGCTLPGSVIRINGEALKVYPSGAFAGFIPLKPGKNQFLIESVHPKAGVATKTLLIESRIREKEKAVADFAIESANLVPSVDQDLRTGCRPSVRA